jgi:hypothetical protein
MIRNENSILDHLITLHLTNSDDDLRVLYRGT